MFLEFTLDLLSFAIKVVVLFGVVGIFLSIVFATFRRQPTELGDVAVVNLSDHLRSLSDTVEGATLGPKLLKTLQKDRKKAEKESEELNKRVFVIDFDGDTGEAPIPELSALVNLLVDVCEGEDEVVLRLQSSGGMVHDYGLAAAQLVRLRQKNIRLTVCVDSVAASGGYMMAAVANRLVAAPFAILGSVGVIVGFPNFHRLLKKYDVDYLELTAGEYKASLSQLGEVTEKGRAKSLEELAEVHGLFKGFVKQYRPDLDIDKVATGEAWYGIQALELKLADVLSTSDEVLQDLAVDANVFRLEYVAPKTVRERLSGVLGASAGSAFQRIWTQIEKRRHPQ